jgi:hypothetical protein
MARISHYRHVPERETGEIGAPDWNRQVAKNASGDSSTGSQERRSAGERGRTAKNAKNAKGDSSTGSQERRSAGERGRTAKNAKDAEGIAHQEARNAGVLESGGG